MFFCILFFLHLAGISYSVPVQASHATVELIAKSNEIVPGESFNLAIRFNLEKNWHIYWKNPGASGLAPEIDWILPEGIKAGAIQWPAPQRIELGGLVNYGYVDEVVFVVAMQASKALDPKRTYSIKARLSWLICNEFCLPGDETLEISLPASKKTTMSEQAPAFARARLTQPLKSNIWSFSLTVVDDDTLELKIKGYNIPDDMYFYAVEPGLINPNAPQIYERTGSDSANLTLFPEIGFFEIEEVHIRGILQSISGNWEVDVPIKSKSAQDLTNKQYLTLLNSFEKSLTSLGLPGLLILAFLGGLILNIMPCVLPVLSLKVFSLVKQTGQSRAEALLNGIAYTVGVILSFIALASLLYFFRAFGERVGWGFQLQSPGFVVTLAMVFFIFGLNLFGVFELGGHLVGADLSASRRNDLFGSFCMGVLAAVVGAPCMGPLVATVSGLAVQANISTGLLIFATLGFGLASPYLTLSAFPRAGNFLPKPGLWMESFKQAMGFLLMSAVVFLVYLVGRQGGVDAIFSLLWVLLICALAAWIYGRWASFSRSKRSRAIAKFLTLTLLVLAFYYGVKKNYAAYNNFKSVPASGSYSGQWRVWSSEKVQQELASGRPVFVDFTATWCLICQVNKMVALRTEDTEALFAEKKIVAFEADWTSYDAKITNLLESFGRTGVPLYLLYTPDGEVTVLPQSLTNGLVRAAVFDALQ